MSSSWPVALLTWLEFGEGTAPQTLNVFWHWLCHVLEMPALVRTVGSGAQHIRPTYGVLLTCIHALMLNVWRLQPQPVLLGAACVAAKQSGYSVRAI